MSVEQITPPVSRPASAPIAPTSPKADRRTDARTPSDRVLYLLGAAYVVGLAILLFAPGGTFLDRLRALDGGICSQLPGHSFFPAGQQLPLCARNSGIYLGFACTFFVLIKSGRIRASQLPPVAILLTLGGCVAILGIDGFNSFFLDLGLPHLYQPNNLLRLATGLGTGTAIAALVVPVTNGLLWRTDDPQRSFGSWRDLAVMPPLLFLIFLIFVGLLSPIGGFLGVVLLYPIAIVSTLGLILALTSVNVVFALGITNRLGRFSTWRQTFPLFTLALACAVIELMVLFLLKSLALHALAA